jgi:hypothetical protein
LPVGSSAISSRGLLIDRARDADALLFSHRQLERRGAFAA